MNIILKLSVLAAAIAQVVAAGYLSIGTFEQSERVLPVLIQPVGWTFSIWGLIYTLSLVYAVYQLIPRYDNDLLRHTRVPALLGFTGSIVWLYFAGFSSALVWMTVVVLFLMAYVFTYVVRAHDGESERVTLLGKRILLPYAAWTAVACFVNVQALLVEREVVTTMALNYVTNALLFVGIVLFTYHFFKKSKYSAWYGGVLVWASLGVVVANITEGSVWFALAAGGYGLLVLFRLIQKQF